MPRPKAAPQKASVSGDGAFSSRSPPDEPARQASVTGSMLSYQDGVDDDDGQSVAAPPSQRSGGRRRSSATVAAALPSPAPAPAPGRQASYSQVMSALELEKLNHMHTCAAVRMRAAQAHSCAHAIA